MLEAPDREGGDRRTRERERRGKEKRVKGWVLWTARAWPKRTLHGELMGSTLALRSSRFNEQSLLRSRENLDSDLASLGWGSRFCISSKHPGDRCCWASEPHLE